MDFLRMKRKIVAHLKLFLGESMVGFLIQKPVIPQMNSMLLVLLNQKRVVQQLNLGVLLIQM